MSTRPVVIADRSELFARGVGELLAARGYEVAGVATSVPDLLTLARAHPGSLLLVDEFLGEEGFIKSLAGREPERSVVVMNGTGSAHDVIVALAAGAAGVINKNSGEDHIFAAIDVVAGGGMVLCSGTVDTLREQLAEVFDLMSMRTMRRLALTEREMEVLRRLPSSLTLGQMAAQLFVSRKTVQNNASSLYQKLGVATRSEAVAQAITLGLLPPRPRTGPSQS
jgi:DNA-binding NarL/FixJ family response regulator